jgi:hypothetical protein
MAHSATCSRFSAIQKISGAPVRSFVRLLAFIPDTTPMLHLDPETSRTRRASLLAFAPAAHRRSPRGDRSPVRRTCAPTGASPGENLDTFRNGSWNFWTASLYNAAMLRTPASAASAGRDAKARPARARSMIAGLVIAGLFAGPAQAAPAAAPAAPAKPAKKKQAESGKAGGKAIPSKPSGNKSISLDDEFLVEGKLEKPSAFYVLRRSATDYDWARMDAVFTPLVLESVQDPLF